MKWFYATVLLLSVVSVNAQIDTTSQCWKLKHLPVFTIYKSDSTSFTEKDIKPGIKTVFMLFSPDCDHCQKQAELIFKNKSLFANTQLIMVTTSSLEMIKGFEKKYNTAQYPFITICRDPKLFFGVFFKLQQVPMLAFYGSDGNIKMIHNNGATIKQMKAALEKE